MKRKRQTDAVPGTELLKEVGKPLPASLQGEWADKRDARWVPRRSPAQWRCPLGHRYVMSRAERQGLAESGRNSATDPQGTGCQRCSDTAGRARIKAELDAALAPSCSDPHCPIHGDGKVGGTCCGSAVKTVIATQQQRATTMQVRVSGEWVSLPAFESAETFTISGDERAVGKSICDRDAGRAGAVKCLDRIVVDGEAYRVNTIVARRVGDRPSFGLLPLPGVSGAVSTIQASGHSTVNDMIPVDNPLPREMGNHTATPSVVSGTGVPTETATPCTSSRSPAISHSLSQLAEVANPFPGSTITWSGTATTLQTGSGALESDSIVRGSRAPAVVPLSEGGPGTPVPIDSQPRLVNALSSGGSFVVRDLAGRPARAYSWERVDLGAPAAPAGRLPGHAIFVVDRSGSMWGDMAEMRSTVAKLLALHEFHTPDLLVSLVSYASHGDAVIHVRRQRPASVRPESIAALAASGLTCVSGGLRLARDLVSPSERTVVTLHSDGYANDRSPGEERALVMKLVEEVRGPNWDVTAVNTVAYRASSDFAALSATANAGGGSCTQAAGLRAVYGAMERALRETARPVALPRRVSSELADFVLRVNRPLRRTLLWQADPAWRALGAEFNVDVNDGDEVYRITEINTPSFPPRDPPAVSRAESVPVMLGLARGLVSIGRVTLAKQVAMSTDLALVRQHARALTGQEVAALAAELDGYQALLGGLSSLDLARHAAIEGRTRSAPPDVEVTLPELLAALGEWPGAVKVFLPALVQSYRRRGLKRVPGKWEGGRVVQPAYSAAPRRAGTTGGDGWADLVSVTQNGEEATVNLTLAQPVDLVESATAKRVSEVAGVSLEDLKQYRSFTVVGDGQVNVKELPCRIVDRAAHERVRARTGTLTGKAFDPGIRHDISLDLPLLRGASEPAAPSESDVLRLLRLTALQRLLAASLRDGSATRYSPEQLAALRERHVTPALYFSPPTCYPHADLKEAQRAGQVDSRTRYRVTFGAAGVLSADDLHSANEFVARRWTCFEPDDVNPVEKPTASHFFDSTYMLREKTAEETRRLKLGTADALEMQVYRLASTRRSERAIVGAGPEFDVEIVKLLGAGSWTVATARQSALSRVEAALEETRASLREAVFYVGASGSVPDSWGPALDADELEKRLPAYGVCKEERGGQFYVTGTGEPGHEVVASVFSEESLYSVSWELSSDRD